MPKPTRGEEDILEVRIERRRALKQRQRRGAPGRRAAPVLPERAVPRAVPPARRAPSGRRVPSLGPPVPPPQAPPGGAREEAGPEEGEEPEEGGEEGEPEEEAGEGRERPKEEEAPPEGAAEGPEERERALREERRKGKKEREKGEAGEAAKKAEELAAKGEGLKEVAESVKEVDDIFSLGCLSLSETIIPLLIYILKVHAQVIAEMLDIKIFQQVLPPFEIPLIGKLYKLELWQKGIILFGFDLLVMGLITIGLLPFIILIWIITDPSGAAQFIIESVYNAFKALLI